jgi:2-dehydropantoate 2-reductase
MMKRLGFRKVIILGAGAVGSSVGALLSKKRDVTLVGNREHMKAIRLNGLRISGDINQTYRVETDTRIRRIPAATLVILTTKAYDSAEAVGRIRELAKSDTVILILQNGLGNEKIVEDALRVKANIVRGITTIAAEFLEPGKIRFWNGTVVIGRAACADEIVEVFEGSGIDASVSSPVEEQIWRKLTVNCVVNPLTALFRSKNNEIFNDTLKPVRHRIVTECIEVAEAEGITVLADIEDRIEREASTYTNCSSMCQDIIKGKKTEIDFLNGKIVELAKKHDIEVPVNETLACMIKFLGEKRES